MHAFYKILDKTAWKKTHAVLSKYGSSLVGRLIMTHLKKKAHYNLDVMINELITLGDGDA